jgi:excisionase family DNA binding protein
MKRRTEITVEEQIRIVRRAGVSVQIACADCGGEVLMVTPEEAALAVGVSARTIYRWVEEGKIHFRENAAGALVVCPRSILEQVRGT